MNSHVSDTVHDTKQQLKGLIILRAQDNDRQVREGDIFSSAMTCSTIAWSRWVASAASIGSGESVNTAW